jgi:hypothetical protein
MKLWLTLLSASLVLSLACNGDDGDGPPATAPPTTPQATATQSPAGSPTPLPGSTAPFSFPSDPNPAPGAATLVDVRVGAHPEDGGFDRIVFEFDGVRPAGNVEYVSSAAQCGSGFPVDPQGSHTLLVRLDATNAHDEQGQVTHSLPQVDGLFTVSGPGNSIVESKQTCDFEAVVEWAVGTDGRQPFVVTLLQNPPRVVVDVRH